ncbi:MAG: hypothetical protein IH855_04480 [Bacteroidetes bacterium]|nr:hypothetical protein [Bacteroidota bacterium]
MSARNETPGMVIPANEQIRELYSAGARRVKIVCWPRENECDRCRRFRGAAVDARSAMKRDLVPPPDCRTPEQCALRYLPVMEEASLSLAETPHEDETQ